MISTKSIILAGIMLAIVIGFIVLRRIKKSSPVADDHHEHHTTDGVCCGKHTKCDKGYDNSNLYFDDEELDRFKGKTPDDYTESEIEEFRQVLYTMRQEEVDRWVHCIQTRGIELPAEIKEEVLLMLQ
jgi:hypothetical protein